MIPPEIFIIFLIITGLLFAVFLFGIGYEYWIDIICGILSTVFMLVLTVLFAAGNVGYTIYTTTLETVIINDASLVFLMGALVVFMTAINLLKIGVELTRTYRTRGI